MNQTEQKLRLMSNPRNIEDTNAEAPEPTPPASKKNPFGSTSLELDALEAMQHTARHPNGKKPQDGPTDDEGGPCP